MKPGELVLTAGLGPKPGDPRKEALREVRRVIRSPESTDEQVEDALEALIELSRS